MVAVDTAVDKLALLAAHKAPMYEPGIQEMLSHLGNRVSFTFDATAAVADADVILITVGTPPKPGGEADTREVEHAVHMLTLGLRPGRSYTVAVKSTVPVGFAQRLAGHLARLLRDRSVQTDVHVAANPEFLRQGVALHDALYPDRIVVGGGDSAVNTLYRLYQPILEQSFQPPPWSPRPGGNRGAQFVAMDHASAEMAKYAVNAFLALKISFANEIAGLCERVGADVTDVVRAMALDPRIGGHYLGAGLGWGGSCFHKDTAALLAIGEANGRAMSIVRAARQVNEAQRQAVVDKLDQVLGGLWGRTVGVLGLAFKPDTDDVRDAPALTVIRGLIDRGATVRAHDPAAVETVRGALEGYSVLYAPDVEELARGCDAVVLATEWQQYRTLDLGLLAAVMSRPILLDARNVIAPAQAAEAGLLYIGVGRGEALGVPVTG